MPNENDYNGYNGYHGNGNAPADNNSFYSPDELNNMLNGLSSDSSGYPQGQPVQQVNPYAADPADMNPAVYPQEPMYQEPMYQEPVYQEPVYQEPVYQEPEPETLDYRSGEPQIPSNNSKAPFKINISDDDYNAPDELDKKTGAQGGSADRPKFEVHIDDDDDLLDFNPDVYNYQEPVRLNFDDETKARLQQEAASKKNPPKKKKKKNPYAPLILFLSIVVILTTSVSAVGLSCVNDILAFSRKSDTVTVTIPADATTDQVIDILSESKLVKQKWFCKLFNYAFTTLLGKSDRDYKGGVYYVDGNLGLEGYLTEFSTTQTGAETYMVTIPEGYTIYQIAKRLDDFGVCDQSKFLASVKGTSFSYSFLKDIGDNSNRTFKLEGYLYPDTYEFYEGDDPNNVIRKMLDRSDEMWTDEYQKRADELGYTRDQIMIIASIIQREAANTEQMDEISSVIHNRLSKPSTWPSIDCDSTSNYITSYIAPYVSNGETTKYTSAYNTYSIKGLPPGPICNPGDDAIEAALYPSDTDYYFFRHDNSGKIYLATTQAEHDANANLVLKANKESD